MVAPRTGRLISARSSDCRRAIWLTYMSFGQIYSGKDLTSAGAPRLARTTAHEGEHLMSREENKDIVRRFHDGMLEFFRTGNLDFLLHSVHPDCAFGMPGMHATVDGMKQALPAFRTAFPDLCATRCSTRSARAKPSRTPSTSSGSRSSSGY